MVKKKLTCLIVYINNAHGFKGPAVSIQKSLEKDPSIDVHCVDLLAHLGADYSDNIWKTVGVKELKNSFRNYITYHYTQRLSGLGYELEYQVIRKRLKAYIEELNPDFIISTHFGTNGIIARLLKRNKLDIHLFSYDAEVISFHTALKHPRIDDYVAPTLDGYAAQLKAGVPAYKSFTSSYPLDNKFKKKFDTIAAERKKLGLADMFTILLSFGGEGIGSVEIIREVVKHDIEAQIVVLCGRNAEGYSTISRVAEEKKNSSTRIIPLGFIDNMQDYLYCSDISAGKAGMNTTFESIYLRRPFIVTKYLQNELVNVNLIRNNEIGWLAEKPADFVSIIKKTMADPQILAECRKRMENIHYTFSSDNLARDIVTRYQGKKRIRKLDTLFLDLAGTLCDIPIGEIWDDVNTKGFLRVLDDIKYTEKAASKQVSELAAAFIGDKTVLRKEAKKTLREFYLGTQLSDFFSKHREDDPALDTCLKAFDMEDRKTLQRWDRLYMQTELDITVPFANVVENIRKLAGKYTLYLLSNNASTELVHGIVEKLGIGAYLKKIYISSELGWRKPHKNFIGPIMKELGANPENIAMIGDRLNQDILLAQENGLLSVFLSAVDHPDNDSVSIPFDLEVKSLDELTEMLTGTR